MAASNPFEGHFDGALRDLCFFDRNLSSDEIERLYSHGLRPRPSRNSKARLAATSLQVPIDVSTNVVTSPGRTWTHRRFSTEDGLPDNVVKAVLQARDGYLWVGTEKGLARFDGKTFRHFNAENTPALAEIGETVFALSEGSSGTLWAGIFGGLLRIRNFEFTPFTNGLPQRFILQAEEALDGTLWVAGFNTDLPRGPMMLRKYDPETQTSLSETMVPGHIRRLIAATNGVWIASEQPSLVQFWDGRSATPSVLASIGLRPPEVQIASRAEPSAKITVRTWCIQQEPLYWWASVFFGDGPPRFSWLWHHGSTRPWSARWAGRMLHEEWSAVLAGLAREHGDRLEKIDLSGLGHTSEIAAACANREGGIWLGSEEDGLHFLQEKLVQVFTSEDGLLGNDVRSLTVAQNGDLWAGTFGGLAKWQNGTWHNFGQGHLRTITTDHRSEIWYATTDSSHSSIGRDFVDFHATNRVALSDHWNHPNSLKFARDGTLWVACQKGLSWLKPARLTRRPGEAWKFDSQTEEESFGRYEVGASLPSVYPLGIVEDEKGHIWVGSLNGGGLFQLVDGTFRRFSQKEGLPGKNWIPVLLDSSNSLWIVTDKGLARRTGDRFQMITAKDGLPSDSFSDLIEDSIGNFWISGKRGIHRLNRSEAERFFTGETNQIHTITLGTKDGMLTPECSSMNYPSMARTPDGLIWVATRKGVARFDPERVVLDTKPLPSSIDKIAVNDSIEFLSGTERSTAPLILEAGSGERLEFQFSAVSLTDADRIKFRHRLDGYDTDWSLAGDSRLAFYTNLRPGDYCFRVEAANGHGIWSGSEARLAFVIQPFFWQTRTFAISLGTLAIALAFLLHLYYLRRQKLDHKARHEQLMLNEKSRIAADLHDELGARLTQIAILGEIAKTQKQDAAKTDATLTSISEAARAVTASMSELVWATNPRNDSLENLVAHLRELAAVELENLDCRSALNFPSTVPVRQVSALYRRNFVLILKEAIHNISKHAGARSVAITVEVSNSSLKMKIADDGRGFAGEKDLRQGNGLLNMQKRAMDLGGCFTVHSVPGEGTSIEVVASLRAPTDH